ncbi:ABC transporter ATP-binding protein [Clostridium mediterraneense]|uniref:ABC transporter ATP-binding protein n=1 Tax=Clostridium mediterraneense TaxID=1805472 RepID=UPI00083661E8|nr:ABC transporter ATP-binding protein [Clostridium mediterraneense]
MKVINCEGLSKIYKEKIALKNVSFSVEGTGCIGFLGKNGAGKTTTIKILAGLAKATSGKVEVVGYDVSKYSKKIRKVIGYCPQMPMFYDYMTALEWMYWIGSMFKLDKKTIENKSEELLKKCGIWEERNRKIGEYSGGMKQRLAIAQALINNPKLLILDEPVSALDPIGRYDVLKLIEELKSNMTIFISTHIIDDIARVADEVVIIDKGSVVIADSMESLLQKYAKNVIEFSIEQTDKNIKDILAKRSYIYNVEWDGVRFKVSTDKKEEASKEILKMIIDENLNLLSYNEGNISLEDIFLKVVSSNYDESNVD